MHFSNRCLICIQFDSVTEYDDTIIVVFYRRIFRYSFRLLTTYEPIEVNHFFSGH